jgi:cytochrome c-type biogenesis protein CcmH/NrfF
MTAARIRPGLLVLLALVAAMATLGIVAARGHGAPAGRSEQVQQIAAGLHCPICKDLSVADSPAPLAQQMRAQIEQELGAGRSPDQIRAGFVAAYGDSVLMTPPRHGVAGTAYALPLGIVGTGVIVVVVLLRRWRRPEAVDDEPAARLPAAQRLAVRQAVELLREEEPG